MFNLQNQYIIVKKYYQLTIKQIGDYAYFQLIADRQMKGQYHFYEGKLNLICAKSKINDIMNNQQKFVRLVKRYFQNQQQHKINIDKPYIQCIFAQVSDKGKSSKKITLSERYVSVGELNQRIYENRKLWTQYMRKRVQNQNKCTNYNLKQLKINNSNAASTKNSTIQNNRQRINGKLQKENSIEKLGQPKKRVKLISSLAQKKKENQNQMQEQLNVEQKSPQIQNISSENKQQKLINMAQLNKSNQIPSIPTIPTITQILTIIQTTTTTVTKPVQQKNIPIDPRVRRQPKKKQQAQQIQQGQYSNEQIQTLLKKPQKKPQPKPQILNKHNKEIQQKTRQQQQQIQENKDNNQIIQKSIIKIDLTLDNDQSSQNKIQNKWWLYQLYANNFSRNQNKIKYDGDNFWSLISFKQSLRYRKRQSSFKIKIVQSKFNHIAIGVTSLAGIITPGQQYVNKDGKVMKSFHSIDPKLMKYVAAKFKTGDEIKVVINWQELTVKWLVNGIPYILQGIHSYNNQILYPCIEMYTKDDIIEWVY